MKTNTKVMFNATTMGGTTLVTSPVVNVSNVYTFAFQHTAAGTTASGSLQLQASCDEGLDEQGTGVSNWANIDAAISIASLITAVVNKDGVGYKWIRFQYTPASGNGTLTVTLSTKGA